MSLRKPSELFGSKTVEETNSSPAKKYLNESYQQFQGSLFKIEELEEKLEAIYTEYPKTIEVLSEKLSNRVTKTELDNKMFTHLSVVDENFEAIKNQVKGLNKNDLREFKNNVSQLTSIVQNLIDVEFPQYKNKVIRNEIKISEKFTESENKVANELNKFSSFLDEKINEFEITKDDLLELADTYKKLNSIVNDKYTEQDKKIQEYSNVLDDFNNRVNNFTNEVEIKINDYENYITNEKEFVKEIKSDVAEIKADVIVYEKHVKKDINRIESHIQDNEKNIDRIEEFIQDNKKDLVDLKENVIKDLSNLLEGDVQNNIRRLENKINDIREKYDTIKPEEIIQDIQESLLSISPEEKNSDPLTPLDQNYVTKSQLENHYRLFLNRIQQQLSTLGGGGAVNIKDMDDVDSSAFVDGKFLKYNSTTGKWEGADASGGGGSISGISTISGVVNIANDLNVAGVSTFNDDVNIASDTQFNIGPKLSTQYQSSFDIIYTNNNASQYILASNGITLQNVAGQKFIKATSTNTGLYHVGTQKLRTSTDGVQVVNNASGALGTMTALNVDTTFLKASGVSTFAGNADFSSGIDVTGNITGTNNLLLDGNVNAQGNVTAGGNINCNGSQLTFSNNSGGKIRFLDTNNNPDYSIESSQGLFQIYQTAGDPVIKINSDEHVDINYNLDLAAGLDVIGTTNLRNTNIARDLDVDGHTDLDNVSIAGIVTVSTPSASKGARNISISTEAPSGGSDGDLWFTYIA